MKFAHLILFLIGIIFCLVGLNGHTSAFVAGALCFFASTMLILQKNKK